MALHYILGKPTLAMATKPVLAFSTCFNYGFI